MAGFVCPTTQASFTTNGDTPSIGYFTVADATGFSVGALVNLSSTTKNGQFTIVDVNLTTNTIGVRAVYPGNPALNAVNYGLTSISGYTTAQSAAIFQPSQLIYSNPELTSGGGGGGGGGFTIGAFGGTSAAGLSLSGGALSLNAADGTHPGGVSTAAQTFAGAKTFSGGILTNSVGASSASVLSMNGAPTDASNAVGVQIGSSTSLANSTAKLVSIKNSSTEKAYIDKDGSVVANSYGLNSVLGSTTGMDFASSSTRIHGPTVQLTTNSVNLFLGGGGTSTSYSDDITSPGAGSVAHILDTKATYSTTGGKLLSVRNNTSEKLFVTLNGDVVPGVDGNSFLGSASKNWAWMYVGAIRDNSEVVRVSVAGSASNAYKGNPPDGATAVAHVFDANNSLVTSGARLASFRNATVEKAYVTFDGNVISTGGFIAAPQGFGNNTSSGASQGMQFSGSTTRIVGGGNGATVELRDNSGNLYLSANTSAFAVTATNSVQCTTGFGNNQAASTQGLAFSGSSSIVRGATVFIQGANGGAGLLNIATMGMINAFNPQSGTSYIVLSTDYNIGMSNDAARTVTLPGASQAGTTYRVIDTSNSVTAANTITVSAASGTIKGSTGVITPGTNTTKTFVSDGTNYWVVAVV